MSDEIATTKATVLAIDGLKIATKTWYPPKGAPERAKILFVHGFAEYIGIYDNIFPAIVKHGYEVTMFDQRGHGATARDPSDYGVGNDYYSFKDLDHVIEHVYKDYKGPLVMWGHSMGGGITLNYSIRGIHRERFNAFLANSPYTDSDLAKGIKVKMLPLMNKIVPLYREKMPLDASRLTDDEAQWPEYASDELRHNTGTVALMHGMISRGKALFDPAYVSGAIDRPLLICHGTKDIVCSHEGSKRAFGLFPNKDKTFKSYEGWRHELYRHKAGHENLQDIVEWLDEHFPVTGETKTSSAAKAEPISATN